MSSTASASASQLASGDSEEGIVLSVEGLDVSYRRRGRVSAHAVREAALVLHRGEALAVVGESGSGKTTLARAVLGLLPPGTGQTGTIRVMGQDLASLDARARRALIGRRIGYIPQDPATSLDPLIRVIDQVVEPLRIHGIGEKTGWRERALQAMRDAGIADPESLARRWPHELSGGQRQRILIAAAIVTDPELILADEPTSALDVTVQKRILDGLDRLRRERGTALLMITHDLAVAAERTDRIALMQAGRVVETGSSEQLLTAPESEEGRALVRAIDLEATGGPAAGQTGTGTGTEGGNLADPAARTAPWDRSDAQAGSEAVAGAPPILAGRGISRSFGSRREPVRALQDADFALARGGSLAVVGESGSGKTTLARIVLGLEKADAGEVLLDGEVLTGRDRGFRRRVQPVFQNPHSSFDPSRSVGWSVLEPLRSLDRVGRAAGREIVAGLFRDVGLDPALARRRPRELSGGQLQRAAIARALSVEPEVLVCDEAVSALDASVQAQVLHMLARLRHERGLSLLFITHDLSVVRWLCEEVVVMHGGEIVEQGPVREVFVAPREEYTRELIAAIPRPIRAAETATRTVGEGQAVSGRP